MTIDRDEPSRAQEVAQATRLDGPGDIGDEAERLTMIMEAEALQAALDGAVGEGELEGSAYPLESAGEVLRMEGADDDGSDDARHATDGEQGGWRSAEEEAMRVLDEHAEPERKARLTAEDAALLGLPVDER